MLPSKEGGYRLYNTLEGRWVHKTRYPARKVGTDYTIPWKEGGYL